MNTVHLSRSFRLRARSFASLLLVPALLLCLAAVPAARAGIAFWTSGSAADTNWSNGLNWSGGTGTGGVPGPTDDVVLGNIGTNTTFAAISNVVDSTSGNFAGTIASLSYTNSGANSFHHTFIAPGVTLNLTGASGPFGSALFAGTPTAQIATSIFATISGANGTLTINNAAANIVVDQVASSAVRATLNMTNLGTLYANINRIAIGSDHQGIATAAGQGTLYLARSNFIATSFVGNYSTPYTIFLTNAIEIGTGNAGNIGANFLYLGVTNVIFTDSIGVGRVKDTTLPGGFFGFNPSFVASSPVAYIRGVSGGSSRVTSWGIADNAASGASSATTFGSVDFSGGTVDARVDTLFIGRDRASGSATSFFGVLSFTAGTMDINNLIIGNQSGTATGSGCQGTVNVNGANARLVVNSNLELGHTTITAPNTLLTRGVLNVTNGTVTANNISVGAVSQTNIINLNGATLTVANAIATNANGVSSFFLANSTLGLTIASNTSLRVLVGSLNTGGATNVVSLSSVPVFPTYPTQFVLIKYTNSVIGGAGFNIGLSNVPVSVLNASLANDTLNRTINLVLPTAPYPTVTSQPQGVAVSPGDTANYSVTATGVPTLYYQWRKDGVDLTDGGDVSGANTSTLSLANVTTGDNAYYSVVITNAYGSTTSASAILFVSAADVPPFITADPVNVTIITNQTATFNVGAAGKPLPDYHWLKNGTNLVDGGNISGVTTATLTIMNAQLADEGSYSCTLTNLAGFTNSAAATLTVNIPPTISVQPVNVTVVNGSPAGFSVTASGKPNPSYQWLKNGFPITDQTNSTLSFAGVFAADAATYSVVVSSVAGTVTSSTATLIVNSTMTPLTLSPANGTSSICVDTLLQITFDVPPSLGTAGRIRIYNASNTNTPVDTIDIAANAGNGTQQRAIGGATYNTFPVLFSGNTANIYPHLGVLAGNQTYFVTIENVVSGTFKDASGATFSGITTSNVWRFTTKSATPANVTNMIVAADGSGDFCTVQGAIDFVPGNNTTPRKINVRNGTYREIVYINQKTNLTFIGETRDQVMIGYANNDTLNGGTALRPSFRAQGSDLAFVNLTLTNMTPRGGSQSEALRTDGKRIIVFHSKLASFQDTMLNNNNGDLVYVEDTLIQGDTDFIWGGGTTFLTNSEIRCLTTGSHVTQARTAADTNGFSFVNCTLTRSNGTVINCDFGRSLGFLDGNVAFVRCLIDDHITGWGDSLARSWEFGNSNLIGTLPVVYNGVQLPDGDPRLLLAQSSFNWLYGWTPQVAPVILTQPVSSSVPAGQPAAFSVNAIGVSSPTYQWQRNGTNLVGQTSATLNIASANANDAGTYAVIVSNAAGTVTSTTVSLTVANTAPTLTPVSDVTVNVGVTVNAANTATDPDVPAQSLTYSLLTGPTNAAVDPGTGNFTWRPLVSQANTVNPIAVVVTDNGSPNLSATNTFTITVNPLTAPSISAPVYTGGQFSLTVSGQTGPDYAVQVSTNLDAGGWVTLFTTNSPSMPFIYVDPNGTEPNQFYRVIVGPPLP